MKTPCSPLLTAAFALALAAAAPAAEPAPTAAPAAPATSDAAAPTPDKAAERIAADLAAMKAANPLPIRDDAAIVVDVQPDGTRSVELDDSFLSTLVVRLGPDGKPVFGCVDSREQYDAFFSPKAAPATPTPEVR